jgi:glycine cleavage system H lipoate-binding protein
MRGGQAARLQKRRAEVSTMTVLIVLVFFALFITLDYVIHERRLARQTQAQATPAPDFELAWVAGYQMPESLYYHRGHTWARPLDADTVLVGVDDFAHKLIGAATLVAPSRGDWLHQGDRAFSLQAHGKLASLVSPVEGEVVAVNPELSSKSALMSDDPYGRGWVLQVKSPKLASNLRNLLTGRLARKWMEDSREALELRLMALSGSVLQDGGEPVSDLSHHLPKADWERLAHEFLLT